MTKGKNRAFDRRKVRKAEKTREPLSRGKMMGRVCGRNYGGNGPADGALTHHTDDEAEK